MKTLVVDASVVVKWQLDDEEHVDKANAIKGAFLRGTIEAGVMETFSLIPSDPSTVRKVL